MPDHLEGDREGVPQQGRASQEDATQEQEPRLKYERFGSDVPDILDKQAATRLCISDKNLALGAHNGTVYVLDYDGNEVRSPHQKAMAAAVCNPALHRPPSPCV